MTAKDLINRPGFAESATVRINAMRDMCHDLAAEAGWWPVLPATPEAVKEKLLLIHTEISEATEGFRKDLMDDHLPHRKMFDVELADAVIRIMDLAGAAGVDIGAAVMEKLIYNADRQDHKPENRALEGGKKF
jgi:hypothetical protein